MVVSPPLRVNVTNCNEADESPAFPTELQAPGGRKVLLACHHRWRGEVVTAAQLQALLEGLDWRRVHDAGETRAPVAAS
jgi:hypothetical protein